MSDVKVTGLKELEKSLKALPENIQKNILKAGIRAGASSIAKVAKQKVPKRTKNLQKAIKVKARRQKDFRKIKFQIGYSLGTGAKYDGFYGPMVEFGTSKMQAQPHMRPALEEKAPDVISDVRKKVKQRLDKEVQKARNA